MVKKLQCILKFNFWKVLNEEKCLKNIRQKELYPKGTEKLNKLEQERAELNLKEKKQKALQLRRLKDEFDDAMNIFVEGGSDITLCVTPYINSIVGTYELPSPQMDDVDDGGVVFINYNGDVLYQYNTTNMQALSSLPALPNNQDFNYFCEKLKDNFIELPVI